MKIIGFSGKAGAGKDTSVALLMAHFRLQSVPAIKASFASPIKDIANIMFGWDRSRLDTDLLYKESALLDDGTFDPACQALGMTRREVLQKIGTEAMRDNLHKDIWIISMKLRLAQQAANGVQWCFITDCRFPNEIDMIHSCGGRVVRIERGTPDATSTLHTEHASENLLDGFKGFDAVVQNDVNLANGNAENSAILLRRLLDAISED